MVLCNACGLIFSGKFKSFEPKDAHNISWRDHHSTVDQFEDSVLGSCPVCMIVCERLRGGVAALEKKSQMSRISADVEVQQAQSSALLKSNAFSKYAFKSRPVGAPGYDGLLIEIVRSRPIIGMSNVLFNLIPQKGLESPSSQSDNLMKTHRDDDSRLGSLKTRYRMALRSWEALVTNLYRNTSMSKRRIPLLDADSPFGA